MKKHVKTLLGTISLVLVAITCMAQDGNAGINQATSQVKSYFSTGTNLMYAIGAIVGLVGAIKVYKKWLGEKKIFLTHWNQKAIDAQWQFLELAKTRGVLDKVPSKSEHAMSLED